MTHDDPTFSDDDAPATPGWILMGVVCAATLAALAVFVGHAVKVWVFG